MLREPAKAGGSHAEKSHTGPAVLGVVGLVCGRRRCARPGHTCDGGSQVNWELVGRRAHREYPVKTESRWEESRAGQEGPLTVLARVRPPNFPRDRRVAQVSPSMVTQGD